MTKVRGKGLEVCVFVGWRRLGLLGLASIWLAPGAGLAQRAKAASELAAADTTAALMEMAAQAGVIFVGHVISITANDAAGYVDVRFAIDRGVRGCPATGEYSVREWAGLWAGHPSRYQTGQRFLMMLHLPAESGMSAPVGGVDGAIPLVSAGAGPVMDANGTVAADTGAGPLSGMAADLRWVQARANRTLERRQPAAQNNALQSAAMVALAASIGTKTQAALESVLAVLGGVGSGSR